MTENAAFARRIETLERVCHAQAQELAELRAALHSRLHTFDAPHSGVTISERKRFEFAAALAQPRRVIRLEARNTVTGKRITSAEYSALQLERFALRFARLTSPTRRDWRGDRAAFGLMRELFREHGALVRNVGRTWQWAVWPAERRAIALAIVTALSPKTHGQKSPRSVNA